MSELDYTHQCVPDAYVLNVGILFANLINCHFHAVRKALGVALEIRPSALELALAVVILNLNQQALIAFDSTAYK